MSSTGNGTTIPSQTRVSLSSLKNSVTFSSLLIQLIGLPADIVPSTFKKKRPTASARVKGDEGDEKPGRPTDDGERDGGYGRGMR